MSSLKRQALAKGASADTVDGVDDTDDPREAILYILLDTQRQELCSAPTAIEARLEKMEQELSLMTVWALKQKALQEHGVDRETVEAVDDAVDPKTELLTILLEALKAEASADSDSAALVRIELEGEPISALRRRAEAAGIGQGEMDTALDDDSPKIALVNLLLCPRQHQLAGTKKQRPHFGLSEAQSAAATSLINPRKETNDPLHGLHCMLSYDWSRQTIVIAVRKALVARGLKTWMDVDGGMVSTSYAALLRCQNKLSDDLPACSQKGDIYESSESTHIFVIMLHVIRALLKC